MWSLTRDPGAGLSGYRPLACSHSVNPAPGSRVRLHIHALPRDYQSMRRSANLSAEKLVGDYLGRVLHAAQRVLPKGDRLLFGARTRAAIMKKVGPLAAADPAKVLEILTDLGDPQTMAKNELERLETAHRGGPPKPVGLWKPVKDAWKPTKADTEPIPRQPAAPPSAAQRPAGARPAEAGPAGARPAAPPSAGPSPTGP